MMILFGWILIFPVILVLIPENSGGEIVAKILGGENVARIVAVESGYDFLGSVKGFPDTYILIPDLTKYPTFSKRHASEKLQTDSRIQWAEVQHSLAREKRDFLDISDIPHERVKRLNENTTKKNLNDSKNKGGISRMDEVFNDELWGNEWYMKDMRSSRDLANIDLNVLKVYQAGISGKGVRISVIDDGLEYTHEDLIDNYDPEISYDCNEDDFDPMPRYDSAKTNNHGTRCAGEIAMVANNKKCGVGVAFNAKIGGIKLLDGLVTDRLEGTALGFAVGLVDIYSSSWGPTDDGITVDGPGKLAREALERGAYLGRGGRGSIFVWATGNGGGRDDNCNCDGYVNSIYTISIGSVSESGRFPWYGEECASLLAVTYSSGTDRDQMIVTTDLYNNCTVRHTGTSASAPLAAGIIALALEVNPYLTWRDIQHLIVLTSEKDLLTSNPDWRKNGAGFWFSPKFGFGLLNAYRLVKRAAHWSTVPKKSTCKVSIIRKSMTLQASRPLSVPVFTSGCKWTVDEINYLEHVEIRTNVNYSRRGSLEIYLTSPFGTEVQLLSRRRLDNSREGFIDWSFMSVMTWGESPEGIWILSILDKDTTMDKEGSLGTTDLIFHGTKKKPRY